MIARSKAGPSSSTIERHLHAEPVSDITSRPTTDSSASAPAHPEIEPSTVFDSSRDRSLPSPATHPRSAAQWIHEIFAPGKSASRTVAQAKDATNASKLFDEGCSGDSPAPITEPASANTVFVKHNSAFNSDRHGGMTKREQVEYIEKLKAAIVGE